MLQGAGLRLSAMNPVMNNAHPREVLQFKEHAGSCHMAASGAAGWLGLAAAPTFVVIALLTGVQESGEPDIFCSAMHKASFLGGMAPMYVLMAAFHLDPWLKLIFGRRSSARRS
jgi:hypothetical protein